MKGSNLLWRGVLILAILVTSVVLAWPLDKKINLGLDLQGGMHLVLQVHTEDALRAETDSDMDRILQLAQEEGAAGAQGRRTADDAFEITAPTPAALDKVVELAEENRYAGRDGRWQVASRGNGRVVFEMNDAEENAIRNSAVNQAKQTIDNRINAFGVAEPIIAVQAHDYRILVQLPGVDDPERVRNLIKNTAFLEFRIVENGPASTAETLLAELRRPPAGRTSRSSRATCATRTARRRRPVLRGAEAAHGHRPRPEERAAGRGPVQRARSCSSSLTPAGADKFGELTGSNVGRPLAIVLDGRVVSAPTIQSQHRRRGRHRGRLHASRRPRTSPRCCAPARCRPALTLPWKSARSDRRSAATRSSRASWPAIVGTCAGRGHLHADHTTSLRGVNAVAGPGC